MQTFLPVASFADSAACLDRQRLGKQRVEVKQILFTLLGDSTGWINHPAVKMWRHYETSLAVYGIAICVEWRKRGYKDTILQILNDVLVVRLHAMVPEDIRYPHWLGEHDFHASHRSNLLRKDPEHYGQFGWTESADLPYVWPSEKQDDIVQAPD